MAGGCAGELAGGHPRRAVALCAAADTPGGPSGALADRADEQVTEHLIKLRDARPRDSLHRGVDGGGRRVPAEDLRGGRGITGEAAGPLRGVRNLRQRLKGTARTPSPRASASRSWSIASITWATAGPLPWV